MKRLVGIVMVGVMAVSLVACDAEKDIDKTVKDVADKVESAVEATDEHVLAVKGGSPTDYPDITYEEAFESFFSEPTWRYFEGTKKGPDDDGDGKEDYTESNIDVVEFTGNCMYADVEVKALIQFELDTENGTFEASYLSFNDVPQSVLIMNSLIIKAFESYSGEENDNIESEDETEDDSVSLGSFDIAGKYSGVRGNSYAELNMDSHSYGDVLGHASIYIDSDLEEYGGIEYTGDLYPYEKNVFMLGCDDGKDYLLSFSEGSSGIEFTFSLEGSELETYFMMEHFESYGNEENENIESGDELEDDSVSLGSLDIAGKYSGVMGNSYAEFNMYTSPNGDDLGHASIYIDSDLEEYGGIEYTGEVYPYEKNVYMLGCDDGRNYLLSFSEGSSGIEFTFSLEGSELETYFMMEHFES